MGSKQSSTSNPTSNTSQQDNRIVAGEGAIALASGAKMDMALSDSRTSNYTSNYTGTDPGAVQFAQLAAELAGAVNESSTDAVRFMTSAGQDTIQRMGESVTSLYGTAGSNNTATWGQTVGAAERMFTTTASKLDSAWRDTVGTSAALLGDITNRAGNTADAAGRLAEAAIASYQPTENKQADTSLRLGMLAAAAVAALVLVPKLMK